MYAFRYWRNSYVICFFLKQIKSASQKKKKKTYFLLLILPFSDSANTTCTGITPCFFFFFEKQKRNVKFWGKICCLPFIVCLLWSRVPTQLCCCYPYTLYRIFLCELLIVVGQKRSKKWSMSQLIPLSFHFIIIFLICCLMGGEKQWSVASHIKFSFSFSKSVVSCRGMMFDVLCTDIVFK